MSRDANHKLQSTVYGKGNRRCCENRGGLGNPDKEEEFDALSFKESVKLTMGMKMGNSFWAGVRHVTKPGGKGNCTQSVLARG